MKARIARPAPQALLYGFGAAEAGVRRALEGCGLSVWTAPAGSEQETLTRLMEAKHPGPSPESDRRAVIFSGLDARTIGGPINALSGTEAKDALKAVLTPYNQSWTLAHLLDELEAEHRWMGLARQLEERCKTTPRTPETAPAFAVLERLSDEQNQPTPQQLEEALALLERAGGEGGAQ